MRRIAPEVVRWVERMQHPPTARTGEFVGDDAIPPTLLPVLGRMMREQLPVLVDSARLLELWMTEHPGVPVPRAIGMHRFQLEGATGERIVRPYSLWMLQRARRFYLGLTGADRQRADDLLRGVDGAAFMAFPDPQPLARHGMSVKPEA